jgi:UDP-glucose 4-epimerase
VKVLVTGGGGLVGSHVIEHLRSRGHEVRALVRDNVGRAAAQALGAEPVFGLVEQPGSWDAAKGVNAIVHAAAIIRQQAAWSAFATVNVEGTRLAAEAASRHGARLIHLSSVAVYRRGGGNGSGAPAINEDAPLCQPDAADLYGRSKTMAEEALWAVTRRTGAQAVALRPCLVYGERDRLFLPRVLGALRFGVAPRVGSGENTLAMVYVGNVADAVVAALEHPSAQGPFNIANDGRLTQREFFEIVGRVAGRRLRYIPLSPGAARAASLAWEAVTSVVPKSRYPGLGAAVRFLCDENPFTSARAVDQLGWRPATPPAEGLERATRWLVRDS